jgi:hypothetical protein
MLRELGGELVDAQTEGSFNEAVYFYCMRIGGKVGYRAVVSVVGC